MKKSLLTATIFMALASTSAFAHHPAADIVDPDIYARIDENVSDTPHADMVFDDMGRDAQDIDNIEDVSEAGNNARDQFNEARESRSMAADENDRLDEMERAESTINMLDELVGSMVE